MDFGLLSAIGAAFVWGSYIFVLKRSFSGYPPAGLTVLINAAAIAWFLPVTVATNDLGGAAIASDPPAAPGRIARSMAAVDPAAVAVVAGTAAATAAAFVLFLRAIALGDVSYVTPINKVVPMFVLPLEVLLLGEVLAPIQVAGVVVATAAVYVANYEPGSLLAPLVGAVHSRPAQLALVSAACYALADLGKRVALQELAIPGTLWVPLLLAGAGLVLLPAAIRNPPAVTRRDAPKFLAAGALVALGEHLTTVAFASLPASVASPVINTQAIIAVVLGGILLGERYFRVRLVAALLAVVGVSMIAL
ncbi:MULTISPECIES: EamA family transporter [unclassified Halorubrum]|uniref:EamA family transporter n=1 Tax=unclassified Halorubrum TaxID=2642239 RepID=UPI000B98782C|nr:MULTISPECIES: EamA family transporter [unclassified Halorubrum]OYR43719.1 EamA family transporter [Halorubrum sp. Hd13]OYR45892.1 EamA family transporter [Halorubrum sp. Eb13]OYR52477.1 EamA family transporter [Halorubrum sp. Ea1]